MSKTTLKDLTPFWDFKLTLYCILVLCGLSYWSYWKVIPLDHPSVYKQSGQFSSIESCEGGLNAKILEMEDQKGRVIAWTKKQCDAENLEELIGKSYIAFFSTERHERAPIYLEVDGELYYEPGINRSDVFAVIGIGFVVCFFTVIPVLHKRRARYLARKP